MKILFFGTPEFSVPFLDVLIQSKGFSLLAVVTQPDKPMGRGYEVQPSAIKLQAQHYQLPVLQPKTLRSKEIQKELEDYQADCFVVVAYGKMIPQEVLDIPKMGCLNVHPSLLPKYRGPSPMQWAILNGDKETGVSIMLLDTGMDTGHILTQEKIPLDPNETTKTLQAKVQHVAPTLLVNTLKMYASGTLSPQSQNNEQASLTRLLTKEDGHIDWTQTAKQIDQQFRALTPWPGMWTIWKRKGKALRLKILNMHLLDKKTDSLAGTAQSFSDRLYIQTRTSAMEIIKLQPEGKQEMTAKEFLKGYGDIQEAKLQ